MFAKPKHILSEEKEISSTPAAASWIKWLWYGWLAVTFILLVFVLKPFNKAYENAGSAEYSVACQLDSVQGYNVDYNGVVDFVAYPSGTSVGEFTFKESKKYRLRFSNKNGNSNRIKLISNGFEIDSFPVSTNRSLVLDLYKNDKLKVVVSSENGSKSEVALKLRWDNSKTQREIYLVLILWGIVGIWLVIAFGGIHFILPSVLMVLASYNEHLYEPETWMLPMFGFVAITVFLTGFRFLLSKTGLGIVSRLVVLVFDYILIVASTILGGMIWNYKRFGYRLDYDTIIAVLQTNLKESGEFALSELGWAGIALIVLVVLVPLLLWYMGRKVDQKPFKFSSVILILIAIIVGFGLINQSQFINQIRTAYKQYYQEIEKFNFVQKRFANPKNIDASKSETGETYVFVIGESQSKEHMSVYGYHRPTTPFLDSMSKAGNIAVFANAFSSHTHTIMVLQDALTQSNQYNGLSYTDVPSFINVLNAADFETTWLSNQVKLSNWDNIVSAIAMGCEKQIFVNKNIGEAVRNSPYDEKVLPELDKILSRKTKKNRAIFVHLLGNHGKYSERYPESFQNVPSRGRADFGDQRDIGVWEAYDNSIRYNDSIVSEIYDLVNTRVDGPGLVSYFADHSEDLSNDRGHNAGQFTFRMTQIPMFIWANDSYKSKYGNKWNRVEASTKRLFSNDLFFQLGLDLTGVESPLTNLKYDLISPTYSVDTFKTKSGKIVYNDAENSYVHLSRNVVILDTSGQLGRVGTHRTNSLGKLNEVQLSGVKTIELDVKFSDGRLEVGHGESNVMSGLTLQAYLEQTNLSSLDKIWLDVKNLSSSNMISVVNALNAIEERFALKSKLIVETQSQDLNLSQLAQLGFNTCYYLPTSVVDMTRSEQKELAVKIAKQLKYQKVRSISFDANLYDFVKTELENKINPNIDYHTWDFNLNIRNGYFGRELQNQTFYADDRIKTILVSFPSVFDL